MSSKSNILFVILLYFLGKGSSSEVVSVKRNVVDSFLVGENGCRNRPSVFVSQSLQRVNRMVGVCVDL